MRAAAAPRTAAARASGSTSGSACSWTAAASAATSAPSSAIASGAASARSSAPARRTSSSRPASSARAAVSAATSSAAHSSARRRSARAWARMAPDPASRATSRISAAPRSAARAPASPAPCVASHITNQGRKLVRDPSRGQKVARGDLGPGGSTCLSRSASPTRRPRRCVAARRPTSRATASAAATTRPRRSVSATTRAPTSRATRLAEPAPRRSRRDPRQDGTHDRGAASWRRPPSFLQHLGQRLEQPPAGLAPAALQRPQRARDPRHRAQVALVGGQRALYAPTRLDERERDRRLVGEQAEQVHLDEREAAALRAVEHRQHSEDALVVLERGGHDPLGDVARRAGDVAGEARILLDVLDDDRLARLEHPARDAAIGRDAPAGQRLLALARHGLEDELAGRLVVQADRGGLRAEDRARHLDDRLQQRRAAPLGDEDACGDRGAHVGAHRSPPTLVAATCRTVLTWKGVRPGWRPSTRAASPAMLGVANELPLARMTVPPLHATSRSTPGAWNSTGGSGL